MVDAPRRRQKRLIVAGALIVTVLALDTVLWALACRRLDDGAREAARSAGWSLDGSPVQWGGWPIAAMITMHDAVLRAGPDIVPPLIWTMPVLVLRLEAWSPTVLTASAAGTQHFAIGTAPPTAFTADRLVATIDLPGRIPPTVAGQNLVVSGPTGPVRLGTTTLRLTAEGWSAEVADATFPNRDGRPVAPAIGTLRIDGRLTAPIVPMPTATQSAQAWRSRGGTVVLDVLDLHWGALAAAAHGIVTLDPALQPALDGTLTASGLAATIGQLAGNGAVSPGSSTAAQAMLAILAAPTGAGPLTLPISLHDGVLSVARFPVLRLLPLRWD